MNPTTQPEFDYHPSAELVFALVCPLGTDHHKVVETLSNYLEHFKYTANPIRLTNSFPGWMESMRLVAPDPASSKGGEARRKIAIGNLLREKSGRADFMALAASAMINSQRPEAVAQTEGQTTRRPMLRTAHIISSLKRPEEVDTLRRVYGSGFFLIGVAASKAERQSFFEERAMTDAAEELMILDESEESPHGQRTRETFKLADVFVSLKDHGSQLKRFLDLVFGCPSTSPTGEEHAMFMAFSAALRSGDLARQVGAAIVDPHGDLLAVGCNEVPKFGGGHYDAGKDSARDIERGLDSNDLEKDQIVRKALAALNVPYDNEEQYREIRRRLKPSGLLDITEFGRSVHAEMQALLCCVRTGRSTRDALLYTTTFPCHNCCRHIIGAGIKRVVYIEPYPKSKAFDLHDDAISADDATEEKIPFVPFIGVGPRRFFDLFSLNLSTGYLIERKGDDGKLTPWDRATAAPRLQLKPNSYLEHESLATQALHGILSTRNTPNG